MFYIIYNNFTYSEIRDIMLIANIPHKKYLVDDCPIYEIVTLSPSCDMLKEQKGVKKRRGLYGSTQLIRHSFATAFFYFPTFSTLLKLITKDCSFVASPVTLKLLFPIPFINPEFAIK